MNQQKQLLPLDAEAGACLIDASNKDEFGAALLGIARAIAGVDELFGYIAVDDSEPEVLMSQSVLPGSKERADLYVQRFFRHDPAVFDLKKTRPRNSFFQRISRSSIIPHDYRRYCFSEPGFAEKLSLGWRGDRYLVVVSFYGTSGLGREALSKLANLGNMALALLVRQYAPIDRSGARDVVKDRLWRSFPMLSAREADICALTLIGWSSGRIADQLGISPGTVLTYRQRAYQKTGVSSAAQLVPAILD